MVDQDTLKYFVLNELGRPDRPNFITSDDNDVEIINEKYDYLIALALSNYVWSFTLTQIQIAETDRTTLIDSKYAYSFLLPTDIIYLRGFYKDSKRSEKIEDYDMHDGYVYVDSPTLFIDYIKKPCETSMPPYFIDYAKFFIARNLCMTITGDANLYQVLISSERESFATGKKIDVNQKRLQPFPTDIFLGDR